MAGTHCRRATPNTGRRGQSHYPDHSACKLISLNACVIELRQCLLCLASLGHKYSLAEKTFHMFLFKSRMTGVRTIRQSGDVALPVYLVSDLIYAVHVLTGMSAIVITSQLKSVL